MTSLQEPAALVSQRALSEALGGTKKRSKTLISLATSPLPELPQPDTSPPHSPGSKHVRISRNHSSLASSWQQSTSGTAAEINTSLAAAVAEDPPHSQQHPSKHISAAARAAALRPSLVKGGFRRHAAPGAPPPKKYYDKPPALVTSDSGAADRKSLQGSASLYLDEERPGEVQRGADGSRLSILQVIDNDGGDAETHDPEMLKAQREEFLLQNRAVDAKSVPALHKRLIQRKEVMSTLNNWAASVFRRRGTEFDNEEHVDAEQLEEEYKQSKMSGLGVGASLRAYWNATVQDEVELRFNTIRIAWEKEAAADMAELKELREKCKKLKIDLDDTKQQLAGMNIKYEVAQKQVISAQRAAPGKQAAPAPDSDASKPSAGQQALVEATVFQLRTDLNGLKSQLDMANTKAELYMSQASKATTDLESVRAENEALATKLQEAEVQLSQSADAAKKQAKEVNEEDAPANKATGKTVSRPAPVPIKPTGDGAEIQKLKKDLDKLQNEHAKLQVSMKFKVAETEKLTKELKEARMKSPPRAAAATTSPAPAGGSSRASPPRQLSSKSKSKSAKHKDNMRPNEAEPAQLEPESRHADGGKDEGKWDGIGEDGDGVGAAAAEDTEAEKERRGTNKLGDKGSQARGRGLKRHGSKGAGGRGPDGAAAQISSLESKVAKLTEQLKSAQAKAAIHDRAAALAEPITPKSAGTKLAKSDAELQVAEAQIKELKELVKRLQKELKELQGSSSIQQQELTLEVELNKRMRLMEKLKMGTSKVQDTLLGSNQGTEEADNLADQLQQRVETGRVELLELVQALEAEFGHASAELEQHQQKKAHMKRGSSVGNRFTLDSDDLSDLLKSSSRKIQMLASARGSFSGNLAPQRSHAGQLPPAAKAAASRGGTRPASARSVAFVDSDGVLEAVDAQDDVDPEASAAAFHASRPGSSSHGGRAHGMDDQQPWDMQGSDPAEQDGAGIHAGPRFAPSHSQLPGRRGYGAGVGVSTVMGRQGPQVHGARPASRLHGSIEDATRWGGMFERLHASYLDPNGVWRVYTQNDGPTRQVDCLQPLLAGARDAAQQAETAAKVAAGAMTPYGLAEGMEGSSPSEPVSRPKGSSRGAALQPTRRPQSAGPALTGPGPLAQQQQQQQQQREGRAHSPSRSPSPPTQQGAPNEWPFQLGLQGAAPPVLKHNVYQQQPGQPLGSYNVRALTATPQKGIQLRSRPKSAHPNSLGQWDLGPGEGEPQSPPSPQPHVISHRMGNSIGLSVPLHSWSLHSGHPPSMPAGGLLHASGSSFPLYNAIEMMSRMELMGAVKEMQAYMNDVAQRYERMGMERQQDAQIQSELAMEIAAAREHWVAENQYNSYLEEELQRLHCILERVAAQANQDANGSDDDIAAPPALPSPAAQEAQAALERLEKVQELQGMHLNQAEAAASRMNLPSPSSIRAKFKPSFDQMPTGHLNDHIEPGSPDDM